MNPDRFPFTAFFEVINSDPRPVVVGGQAVNLWAEYYVPKFESIKSFAPFLSKDCDIFGTMDTLYELARKTKWKLKEAPKDSASPVLGYLTSTDSDGKELLVEVLYSVKGLTNEELKHFARLDVSEKIILAVPSPVILLKAKISNAVGIPQKNAQGEEKRDDVRHVKILVLCVNAYISEILDKLHAGETTDRAVVNLLESAFKIVSSRETLELARREKIDFKRCFPEALSSEPFEKIQNFCKFRLSTWNS